MSQFNGTYIYIYTYTFLGGGPNIYSPIIPQPHPTTSHRRRQAGRGWRIKDIRELGGWPSAVGRCMLVSCLKWLQPNKEFGDNLPGRWFWSNSWFNRESDGKYLKRYKVLASSKWSFFEPWSFGTGRDVGIRTTLKKVYMCSICICFNNKLLETLEW